MPIINQRLFFLNPVQGFLRLIVFYKTSFIFQPIFNRGSCKGQKRALQRATEGAAKDNRGRCKGRQKTLQGATEGAARGDRRRCKGQQRALQGATEDAARGNWGRCKGQQRALRWEVEANTVRQGETLKDEVNGAGHRLEKRRKSEGIRESSRTGLIVSLIIIIDSTFCTTDEFAQIS